MFPTGQPPFGPFGTGGFRHAPPQAGGMARFLSPFMNQGPAGFGGVNPFGFGAQTFSAQPFGNQALGIAGNAVKSGGAGWLGHMQTAMKALQNAAPMVQQYGPMVKNIPAMINMMKLMNESDDEEDGDELESLSPSTMSESGESRTKSRKSKSGDQGTSQPKLYI